MLTLYIQSGHNIIAKTIHYAINIISTKAELFTIRCRINQAIQVSNASYIIIVIRRECRQTLARVRVSQT